MPSNAHRADIVAAVHKRGSSLTALARRNGYGDSTLRAALSKPSTRANRVIAAFLGKSLHALWPEWFDAAGRLVPTARKPATATAAPSSQNRDDS
jgi:Ner family transcriptional regulator